MVLAYRHTLELIHESKKKAIELLRCLSIIVTRNKAINSLIALLLVAVSRPCSIAVVPV